MNAGHFITSFCTGKELDPDFLAFNSNSYRYHFPARFYLLNRGVFGQVDPMLRRHGWNSMLSNQYSYVRDLPTGLVDPKGLIPFNFEVKCGACSGVLSGSLTDKGNDEDASVTLQIAWAQAAGSTCCCDQINWIQALSVEPRGYFGPYSKWKDPDVGPFTDEGGGREPEPYYYNDRSINDPSHPDAIPYTPNKFDDSPAAARNEKNIGQSYSFETCLVCKSKGAVDIIMGCMSWRFFVGEIKAKDSMRFPQFASRPSEFWKRGVNKDHPKYKSRECP